MVKNDEDLEVPNRIKIYILETLISLYKCGSIVIIFLDVLQQGKKNRSDML